METEAAISDPTGEQKIYPFEIECLIATLFINCKSLVPAGWTLEFGQRACGSGKDGKMEKMRKEKGILAPAH